MGGRRQDGRYLGELTYSFVPNWRAMIDEDGHYSLPWHSDAAARRALQSASLRRPTILHYALRAPPSISRSGPVTIR